MQTPIRQKRPNFRIPYFFPSKCRPLHSAARGGCPSLSPPFPPPLTMSLGVNSVERFSFHFSSDAHDSMTNDRCYLHWRTEGSAGDLVFTRARACTTTMSIAVVYHHHRLRGSSPYFNNHRVHSAFCVAVSTLTPPSTSMVPRVRLGLVL